VTKQSERRGQALLSVPAFGLDGVELREAWWQAV
jgi:hypothetical protein